MRASRGELLRARFFASISITEGCWEWQNSRLAGGYGQIKVMGKSRLAHRVSYELAHGPIPDGLYVLHHCDNPPCVRPDHLFLGTARDNIRDCLSKRRGPDPQKRALIYRHSGDDHWTRQHPDRIARGSGHGRSKLTEDDVRTIRQLRSEGWTLDRLAVRFGVRLTNIHAIVRRDTWRHVE